jgi:FkbM family methyltransferase
MFSHTVALNGFDFVLDKIDSLGLASPSPFEPDTLQALEKLTKPGFRVLDIGANIGFFTAHLARLVGASGQVIAIEPNKENFALLRENVRRNHLTNAVLHNLAVGENDGNAALYLSDWNGGMHRMYESVCCTEAIETVQVSKVDNLVAGKKIDLIKIDIEGYEYFALKGARDCLIRNPHIKIVTEYCPASLMEAGASPLGFLEYLESLGLYPHALDSQALELPQLKDDAARYESYGHDRLVQQCAGKSNPEIIGIVTEIAATLGCRRPIIENLIFSQI